MKMKKIRLNERLEELRQINRKIGSLVLFLDETGNATLSDERMAQLYDQLNAMIDYSEILFERIVDCNY